MGARLEKARILIEKRTDWAERELREAFYTLMPLEKKIFSSKGNGGNSGLSKSLNSRFQRQERIGTLDMVTALIMKSEMFGGYQDLCCSCADCHMILCRGDREGENKAEELNDVQKKFFRSLVHFVNGNNIASGKNKPITLDDLDEKGLAPSGALCRFCDRINGTGNRIRKIQSEESPWPCFGTCFDYCTEEGRCDYQLWEKEGWSNPRKITLKKTQCVIPKNCLSLSEEELRKSWLDYWTWALRVLSLKKWGIYRFNIRRSWFDC